MYEANTIMNIIRSDVASHLRGSMFRQAIYADMATNRGNSTSVVSEMDMDTNPVISIECNRSVCGSYDRPTGEICVNR